MGRRKKKRGPHVQAGVLSQVSQPFRRTPKTAAGTLDIQPGARQPRIRYIRFGTDVFEEGSLDRWERLDELRAAGGVVWIDVDGLGSAEAIQKIGAVFHLHQLALEDVVHVHQRSKIEDYNDHLFIVARMPSYDGQFSTEQLSIFLGRGFVVTFQEGLPGDCLEAVRERLRVAHGMMRSLGSDHLAYGLIDSVVDAYFPIVEAFGDRLNELDEEMSELKNAVPLGEIHSIRSQLLLLRRAVWPHREAINHLLREDHTLITAEARVYLRDCYDHTLQIIDVVETYREMCSDLRDFQLSAASHRANEIMKVLTIISTIFIPLSFIAGVYGMNFEFMPEIHWKFGYLFAWGSMAAVAGIIIFFIWRRGWFST